MNNSADSFTIGQLVRPIKHIDNSWLIGLVIKTVKNTKLVKINFNEINSLQ